MEQTGETCGEPDTHGVVDDAFLVGQFRAGDEAALRLLMDRYDRLVRYTIYQAVRTICTQDPQWLDAVASTTWTGFMRSIKSGHEPVRGKLSAYLVRIARNQTISALRKQRPDRAVGGDVAIESLSDQISELEGPGELLARLEHLGLLRKCLEGLDQEDRILLAQSEAILARRWQKASQALDMAESTLRSRWKRLLGRLEACMAQEMENTFAPKADRGD